MHLPFIQLIGLAESAVNLIQKTFTRAGSKGDFEAKLQSALTGKAGSKGSISERLSGKTGLDEETFQGLVSTSSGMFLFQLMTALKETGLQASDIQAVLKGNGSGISDDALRTMLQNAGIGEEEIAALLADPAMKSQIRNGLAESFAEGLDKQALKDGIDLDAVLKLTACDAGTVDAIVERIMQGKALPSVDPALSSAAPEVTDSPGMTSIMGFIRENVQAAADEIRIITAHVLKKAVHAQAVAEGMDALDTGSGAMERVGKVIDVAENTLGLDRETLKSLFFETDPELRQQAVEQAATRVNAYLKSREGKGLSPEVKDALGFLKTAMSNREFAGIDESLKLWQPGQALAEARVPIDREMFAALLKNMGGETPGSVFDSRMKQVIEQLRQSIPGNVKNGEGHMVMKLHPPMLGQVDVSVTMQDGQIRAAFRVEQSVTRDILVQNMQVLKDALADQGIKATEFTVTTTFDNKSPHDGYAFAGHEKHGRGFARQERGSENQGRSFREDDGAVYARANYSGLLDGGLDLFA